MANKNRKQAFFEEDTPHGLVKRIMYKKYMQAYIAKTQNEKFTLRTMIIDGVAGVGRYGNDWPTEIERYGSPLIALMIALGDCYKKDKKKRKDETGEAKGVDKGKETAVKKSLKTDNQEDKSNTKKDSIWGWPASGLDSEAELTRELESWDKREPNSDLPSKVALIFIEKDPKRFKMLTENVELLIIKFLKENYPSYRYGYSSEEGKVRLSLSAVLFSISVDIINRKFGDTPPPLSLRDSDLRSLTFLDPFGFTQTPMSHVAKFAPCVGNEIFINFMSRDVNRFVSRSTKGVADLYGISDYDNVARGIDPQDPNDEDAVVGIVKTIIHFCQSDKKSQLNNINKCAANYESCLKVKTDSNYSLSFQIKDKQNVTVHHMVHITNNIKGVEAMKESMKCCSQKEGELIMSEYDIVQKGLTLDLRNLDDTVKVAEAIFKRYKGRKRIRLEDIKNYILFETNFVFRKKPLGFLEKEGMITDAVDTEGNRKKKGNTFPDSKTKQPDSKTKQPYNKTKKPDSKTKERRYWLISFSDKEFNCNHENKPGNSTLRRKRMVQSKNSKQLREKQEMLRVKKPKEKQRKIEEPTNLNEEKKQKQNEAKLEKKRKKEAKENGRKRFKKLITEMNPSTPITAIAGIVGGHRKQQGVTNVPNECSGDTGYAAQDIALQIGDLTSAETTQSTEKPTKNGNKRRREEKKENGTNMKQQSLITDASVTQKGQTGCPSKGNTPNRDISTNDVMEDVEPPSDVSQRRNRKRKSTSAACPGDNGKSKKRVNVLPGLVQSTWSSPLAAQEIEQTKPTKTY